MRILFVISGLGLGGAERQVVLLARELVRRGHAVCIYTLTDVIARAEELKGSLVDLVVDRKATRLDPTVLWRLRRHLSDWLPDIVHGFLFDGNLYARLAGAGTGVPVLDSERSEGYATSALHSLGYLLTSALTNGVVANTHAGAEFARRTYHARAGGVHVLWNGIDLAEIDARLSHAGEPAGELMPGAGLKRVCVVGRIKPQKDYQLALRVARRLADSDDSWRVVCVGETRPYECMDYAAQVIADRDRLGLQNVVAFVGNRRDVPELIASCDVLLVTSRIEGFPNVVLEAMACGTPVASTNYSDVRLILPMPWQVATSRDENELASTVMRCHAEHDTVAAEQRRWVEAHATVAISADTLLSVYEAYVRCPAASEQSVS